MNELLKSYEKRLSVLREEVRRLAVKHAEKFYLKEECTKEEALEKGIAKAEMELRKL